MQDKLIDYIFTTKRNDINGLENKKTKILFESCPCCKGMGVMYASRKGSKLRIWCSCRKETEYEDRRYFDK